MSLSKSIGFDELNGMLSTLEKASNFAGALSAIANSGNEYKATTFTQLGKTVNETVNGIQAAISLAITYYYKTENSTYILEQVFAQKIKKR